MGLLLAHPVGLFDLLLQHASLASRTAALYPLFDGLTTATLLLCELASLCPRDSHTSAETDNELRPCCGLDSSLLFRTTVVMTF